MARIMRDYKKTVGARLNKKGMKAVPEVEIAQADTTAATPVDAAAEAARRAHCRALARQMRGVAGV